MIAALVVSALLCLSAVMIWKLPAVRYERAVSLAENGRYDKAISIWRKLDDRKDVDKAIQQAYFDKSRMLLEQGKFEDALAILEELSNKQDVRAELKEARYGYAQLLTDNGQYEKAWKLFEAVGANPKQDVVVQQCQIAYAKLLLEQEDWIGTLNVLSQASISDETKVLKDTCYLALAKHFCVEENYSEADECLLKVSDSTLVNPELKRAVLYGLGQQYLAAGDYLEAVNCFEDCGSYEQAAELRKEAMYGYVQENTDPNNEITCAYLDELVRVRYRDSEALYEAVYRWTLDVYAISYSQNDDSVLLSTVKKDKKMYFFCRLSGGIPGETTEVTYKIYWLSGSMTPGEMDGIWRVGDTGYHSMWYTKPKSGEVGIHRVEYFDGNGNLIGSASVNVVD